MNNEIEDKPKKRGHRKKKFGDQESKVITFRIGKKTYKRNKKGIREDVYDVIESYSVNKKVNKREAKKTKETVNNDVEEDKKLLEEPKENKEKIFIIDEEEYEQRDYIKEFTNKAEEEQPEEIFMVDESYTIHNYRDSVDRDKENTILKQMEGDKRKPNNYFDKFKDNNEKIQAQENIRNINKQDSKDSKSLEEIYEEFKDVIDPNNPRFKKFLRR
ncbi:hypothetical protein LCGC14_1429000 [marine sediment metagenome]|uniref:Uncharacterized protein n=1 Tax=marine sediment metagenome TaxID=412755 RepID=A0A0F9JP66_9ZZZZ